MIVLLCLSILGATAYSHPLSLKEATLLASESSPVLDSAQKTKIVRDLEYSNAIAKMLPSLDFTTTNGLKDTIPVSGSTYNSHPTTAPWSSSMGLSLTETIYDNGISLTNTSIAALNRRLADLNYLKTRENLALSVANAFYNYSQAVALFEVRKQQLTALEKQFKTLSSQYHQGFQTKSDFLRFKTQVQRAEIERVTAESNIATAKAELLKVLGINYQDSNPPSFAAIEASREHNLQSLFPAKTPSLENIYEYRMNKIQEEVNGKSITLAKRNYWPRISLSSAIDYTNQDYIHSNTRFRSGQQLSWNALLTLQYNLWDWGTRSRDVELARYRSDIQENALRQNLLETNSLITGLMANLERINRNYRLSQELLSLEEESNRNLQLQYREGKVSYLDLITSQNSLLDAKVQFLSSYFDARQSLAKYKFYEGTLYASVVEK